MPETSQNGFQLPLFAGVDVGGTNVKVGILDNDGRTVAHSKFPTQAEKEPDVAIDNADKMMKQLVTDHGFKWGDVAAVGLGTPGPMDISAGLILTPNNLPGWRNFPVRDKLSESVGKEVTYANDAAAAAFGEFWIGSGRQNDSLVMFTLGTGVGGGIIVKELSIDGSHSHGAELGHLTIDTSENARICPCGVPGHLEAYASATAVVNRCSEALGDNLDSILRTEMGEASPLSALMISNAADKGDEFAIKVIMETARYLGRGVANMAHVIDPDVFILGGAMNFGGSQSPLGRRFVDEVVDTAKALVFPVLAQRMTVRFAELGGDAGFVGAAGLARVAHLKT